MENRSYELSAISHQLSAKKSLLPARRYQLSAKSSLSIVRFTLFEFFESLWLNRPPSVLRFFVVQPDRTFHHEGSKNPKFAISSQLGAQSSSLPAPALPRRKGFFVPVPKPWERAWLFPPNAYKRQPLLFALLRFA